MPGQQLREPEVLAAVDLGSNSFHMVVARLAYGQITVIDRLREMVRLAAGLDRRGRISERQQLIALECLRRFGERLREMRAERVRVVGTNTLRRARSPGLFVRRATAALGHPVEVISGIEEARLIYIGASHYLPRVNGPQLIVDIGGGSTEIVAGRGLQPELMESLAMGCVGLTEACFPDGRLSMRSFHKARLQARLELEPVRAQFRRIEPVLVAGTSGTIRAAESVLAAAGRTGITVEGLEWLIGQMANAGRIDNLRLQSLSSDRAVSFAGGIAILIEVMDAIGLQRMTVADGALREGILYDMVGRLTDEDARTRTVRAMAGRYHVDRDQAGRVRATALKMLESVAKSWSLETEADREMLDWAASLHELGLDIAHAHYHRHGAYVLENADMPGFTREEQRALAQLVLTHRRQFSKPQFSGLLAAQRRRVFRLAVLLRLAVLFHRSRSSQALPDFQLSVHGRTVRVALPGAWLARNPLTLADLNREQKLLEGAGISLVIRPLD